MMAWEIKPNTGSLFVNSKKTSDKSPNAVGDALIDGKEYRVSAWTRTSSNGNKYQSLSFTEKNEENKKDENQRAMQQNDDEIPF